MFKPNGNRLLLKDVNLDVKQGGIIVPVAALEKRFEQECEVVAVGRDVDLFSVGDIVLIHVNDGLKTYLNGKPFRIFFEDKILGEMDTDQ